MGEEAAMSDASAKRICFDRILPQDLHRPHRMASTTRGRAIAPREKQWVNGSTIRVRFLEGTSEQRAQVQAIAPQWTQHANLKLVFTSDTAAEIRVAFDPGDGAWSYVGIDNLSIPRDQPTLNLGWVDQAVILHEFGHMIGLAHEHQNPAGGIQWNEAAVLADLAGPPNYWDEATTRHNVLRKYEANQIHGTSFDERSIMLYAFPGSWTRNLPGGTRENSEISPLDKEFIGGPRMYPGAAPPAERATDLPVWTPAAAAIGRAGEEDLYRFLVTEPGTYLLETHGATDVFLALFGPNNVTRLIAQDDDAGEGNNSLVRANLSPGEYFATVRHYNRVSTGPYEITVRRAPR
jgi:hypothetical protein